MTKFDINSAIPGSLWQFQIARHVVSSNSPINLYFDEGIRHRLAYPENWALVGGKHFEWVCLADYLLLLPGRQKIGPHDHVKFLHLNSKKVGWIELRDFEKMLVRVGS